MSVTDEDIHHMLSEVDINQNGRIEFGEYLALMSSIKNGVVVASRFAKALDFESNRISVERSGGGL